MECDGALGNLQRLADFRSRLTACRLNQTLALAVAEKPAGSAVKPAQQPDPVGTAPGNARRRVMNGARDELTIRQGREDAALGCGAAAGRREAGEAPLAARSVNGARNPRRQSEFARLGEGLAVPRRDCFPGQGGDFLQGQTAQRTGQEVPAPIGAVSVPANREIIEPDFVNRAPRLGETAAEHEVTEAQLLGDEENRFLEARPRAVRKNLLDAQGSLVAHVVPLPWVKVFFILVDTLRFRRHCASPWECLFRRLDR